MITDQVLSKAIDILKKDKERLDDLIEKNKYNLISKFLIRALEWSINKPDLFWKMFHKAFFISDFHTMSSLHSFTVNYMIECGTYKILWQKPKVTDDYQLCWDDKGELEYVDGLKEDLYSDPHVITWNDNGGILEVEPLLEAMDILEEKVKARYKEIEELENE